MPNISTPKTRSSVRTISVPYKVMCVLKMLKANSTCVDIKQTDFCFSQPKSEKPLSFSTLETKWGKILQTLNFPHRKFHCLRHTHATQLLAAGVPVLEVSRRLGHTNAAITLGVYGHHIKGYDEKIAQIAEKIYCLDKLR